MAAPRKKRFVALRTSCCAYIGFAGPHQHITQAILIPTLPAPPSSPYPHLCRGCLRSPSSLPSLSSLHLLVVLQYNSGSQRCPVATCGWRRMGRCQRRQGTRRRCQGRRCRSSPPVTAARTQDPVNPSWRACGRRRQMRTFRGLVHLQPDVY